MLSIAFIQRYSPPSSSQVAGNSIDRQLWMSLPCSGNCVMEEAAVMQQYQLTPTVSTEAFLRQWAAWPGHSSQVSGLGLIHSARCRAPLNSLVRLRPTRSPTTETRFIKLVFEVVKLCVLMKEDGLYNPLPSTIPTCHNQSKFRWRKKKK